MTTRNGTSNGSGNGSKSKSGTALTSKRDAMMASLRSGGLQAAIDQALVEKIQTDTMPAAMPGKSGKPEMKDKSADKDRPKDGFREAVHKKTSKGHKLLIDFGAGGSALMSSEGINKLVRMLGKWSEKEGGGFWSNNVDYMQSLPILALGFGVYFIELALRKTGTAEKPVLPSGWQEAASEAGKVYMMLGFSNLARAVRSRWDEKKLSDAQKAALTAEREQLLSQVTALKQQLAAKSGGSGA